MRLVTLILDTTQGCWVAIAVYMDNYGPKMIERMGEDDKMTTLEAFRCLTAVADDLRNLDVPLPSTAIDIALNEGLTKHRSKDTCKV